MALSNDEKAAQMQRLFESRKHRYRDTDIEQIVERWLIRNKIAYMEQHTIMFTNYRFTIVDFFIEPNTCLYVDGDYWHSRPDVIESDRYTNSQLKIMGYTVIRMWGRDVHSGIFETALNSIAAFVPEALY